MTVHDISITTISGSVLRKSIIAPPTIEDFRAQLCKAIDNGGAMLDTTEGTNLIINTAAVVAIEVGAAYEVGASDLTANGAGISPPG